MLALITSAVTLAPAIRLRSASYDGQGVSRGQPSEIRDRTSEFLLRMTSAQKAHSRLYRDRSGAFGTRKILDELVSPAGHGQPLDLGVRLEAKDFLTSVACRYGNAFVGRVLSRQSNPIEEGTFLFTDYEIRVEQAFRSASGLRPDDTTTLTRLGGQLSVDGVTVSASLATLPMLEVNHRYLLFPKFLVVTKDFEENDSDGLFEITDSRPPTLRSVGVDTPLTEGGRSLSLVEVFERLPQITCR